MKRVFKVLGIVSFVAVIGFSMVTCDNEMPNDNGNNNNNNGDDKGNPITQNQTPTAADFTISGAGTVYFDGDYKTITVTPKTGKTGGARTVYYEGTGSTEYDKTTNEPLFFGTYKVTFDVEAATGWNAVSGLSAGTLTIADGTPNAPTGVSVAIASLSSLKVSWTVVPRATSYKVFYITEGMEEIALAGTVTTNSFTHNGLTLNLDDIYFYYVTAINTYGVSDYSTFKPIVIAKPVAPNAITATATSSTGINLQWSEVTGATGYKVRYNTINSISGSVELPDTYTSASTPLTDAQANTTYYFWVKAVNPFGESDYSTVPASAKTFRAQEITLGLRVTDVFVSTINGLGYVSLKWNDVNNNLRDYYYIYRSANTPNNFEYIAKCISGSVGWADNRLNPNTTYYYYIEYEYVYPNYYSDPTKLSETIMVRVGSAPPPPPPTPAPPLPPAASTPPSGTVICSRCDGARVCGKCVLGMYETRYGISICPFCKGTNKCGQCNGLGKY